MLAHTRAGTHMCQGLLVLTLISLPVTLVHMLLLGVPVLTSVTQSGQQAGSSITCPAVQLVECGNQVGPWALKDLRNPLHFCNACFLPE